MGTPVVPICPRDSVLKHTATVCLEAEGTLSGRFICLRKMEMWRKCKDALKQLCCGKRRRGGGARRAQPLWDSRHVSSWLKSLLGGAGGCGPSSEGTVSSPPLARQTPVGRSVPCRNECFSSPGGYSATQSQRTRPRLPGLGAAEKPR